MQTNPQIFVIIPAAGAGTRMADTSTAKQFIDIGGKTILQHSCDKFLAWGKASQLLIGLAPSVSLSANFSANFSTTHPQISTYHGGKQRADTVLLGLELIKNQANDDDWVMVHDAARPLINVKDIAKLFNTLQDDNVGGILAEQATSTVKQTSDGIIKQTLSREQIFLAQTPQLFRFAVLYQALQSAGSDVTDEAVAVEQLGLEVKIVRADYPNPKITYQSDLDYINYYLTNG